MRVDVVQFGDGYAQRRPAGLNSVRRKWTPRWSPLRLEQKEVLYDFLVSRQGVHAFYFQPKTSSSLVRVVATDIRWVQDGRFYTVSATFTEDFGA